LLNTLKYVVISPVKNESNFISQTLASMASQTVPPLLWLVVDDASTDNTANLIKDYEKKYPWVKYIHHPGEIKRKTGSAEIHAFNYGLKTLQDLEFDLIVKLDGDLHFSESYFENLLSKFAENENLGIASGIYLESADSAWIPVQMPRYHAAGASKVLRRKCFEQIGGFIAERGWDTIDEIRAQAKGWDTKHFPDITFHHLRKEGAGMGHLHTSIMHGEIFYRSGGSKFFFLLKAIHRFLKGKPFMLGGSAMIYGYFRAWLGRHEMLVNSLEALTYRQMLHHRMRIGIRNIRDEKKVSAMAQT